MRARASAPPFLRRARTATVLATLVLLAATLLWLFRLDATRCATTELPRAERAAIYHSHVAAFRTLCGERPRSDGLERQCRDQALFLQGFPECDARCRALVEAHLPQPTK